MVRAGLAITTPPGSPAPTGSPVHRETGRVGHQLQRIRHLAPEEQRQRVGAGGERPVVRSHADEADEGGQAEGATPGMSLRSIVPLNCCGSFRRSCESVLPGRLTTVPGVTINTAPPRREPVNDQAFPREPEASSEFLRQRPTGNGLALGR